MVDSSDHSCNQQLSDRDVALHLLGHPPENEEEELDAQKWHEWHLNLIIWSWTKKFKYNYHALTLELSLNDITAQVRGMCLNGESWSGRWILFCHLWILARNFVWSGRSTTGVCFCRLESNTFVPYVKYCKVVMLHGVLRQSQLLASRRCWYFCWLKH